MINPSATPRLLSHLSRWEYGYYRLVIPKDHFSKTHCPPMTQATLTHSKRIWPLLWLILNALLSSTLKTEGAFKASVVLALRDPEAWPYSLMFFNTQPLTQMKGKYISGKKKACWEKEDMAVNGKENSVPPKEHKEYIWHNLSIDINEKMFSWPTLINTALSHTAFLPSWELIPFRGARFDDADSFWSLRSNYCCPVKYHNAPKDQFNAWGALSYPLKPQFQPLWKLVHTSTLDLMNTPRQN